NHYAVSSGLVGNDSGRRRCRGGSTFEFDGVGKLISWEICEKWLEVCRVSRMGETFANFQRMRPRREVNGLGPFIKITVLRVLRLLNDVYQHYQWIGQWCAEVD